jgi:hypothetical protein
MFSRSCVGLSELLFKLKKWCVKLNMSITYLYWHTETCCFLKQHIIHVYSRVYMSLTQIYVKYKQHHIRCFKITTV